MKNYITICDACNRVFAPIERNGFGVLQEFEGYTVDLRLKQFRKSVFGQYLEFIEFDSEEGQELLKEMHEMVTK